jgi:superfamily I DNA/RNA helicase
LSRYIDSQKARGIKGSPQQKDIWKSLMSSTSNILVNALAGTGKTTTIVEGCTRIMNAGKIAYVAFGREIAKELKTRLPRSVYVATLHGFGYHIIRHHLKAQGDDINVDDRHEKIERILDTIAPDYGFGRWWPKGVKPAVKKMVSLAKGYGVILPPKTQTSPLTKSSLTPTYQPPSNLSTNTTPSQPRWTWTI